MTVTPVVQGRLLCRFTAAAVHFEQTPQEQGEGEGEGATEASSKVEAQAYDTIMHCMYAVIQIA